MVVDVLAKVEVDAVRVDVEAVEAVVLQKKHSLWFGLSWRLF